MRLTEYDAPNGWTISLMVRQGYYASLLVYDEQDGIRFSRRYDYYEIARAESDARALVALASGRQVNQERKAA